MNLSQSEGEKLNEKLKRKEVNFITEIKERVRRAWEGEEELEKALNLIEKKFFKSESLEPSIGEHEEEIKANMERIKGTLESWREK